MFDKIWNKQIYIVLLGLLGLVVFIKVISFGFVWDDNELYLNKSNYPENNRFQNLSKFWEPGKMPMYAPITYTAWAVIAQVSSSDSSNEFNLNPSIFHILNLFLHIFNSILIFLIIYKLINDQLAAFIGAIIFLLHPIQIESLAWVSELRGLLAAFFGFWAIYIHIATSPKIQSDKTAKKMKRDSEINNQPGGSFIGTILVYLFILLSILSKPTAIVIPLIIFLIDYFIIYRTEWKKSFYGLGISFVIILPIVIISLMTEETASAVIRTPIYMKPMIFIDAFIFYLKKILIPIDFSPVYGRTISMLSSGSLLIVSAIIFIALSIAVWIFQRKYKWLLPAYLISLLGFLPVSGIINFYYQSFSTVADRYFYFSMLGVCVAIAFLTFQIKTIKMKYIITLITVLTLSFISIGVADTWQSELSLWNRVIESNPNASYQSYIGRGEFYISVKNYTNAIEDFTKAIDLNKNEYRSFYNRANAYLDLRQFDYAVKDYTQALLINPKDVNSYSNRGIAYYESEKMEAAIDDFRSALKINADQPDLLNRIGVFFASKNKLDSAIVYFQMALNLNPNDDEIIENLNHARKLINNR